MVALVNIGTCHSANETPRNWYEEQAATVSGLVSVSAARGLTIWAALNSAVIQLAVAGCMCD